MSRADRIRNRGPLAEARAVNEFHRIDDLQVIDGETIIVLSYDMEADPFCKAMPRAIQYNGQILGRTGYNSDSGQCYYKSGANLVQEVSFKVAEAIDLHRENERLRLERDAAIRGREQLLVRVEELEAQSFRDAEHIYGPTSPSEDMA